MTAKLTLVILIGLTIVGCTTRMGDFTLLSTKNVDLSRLSTFERSQRQEGKDIKVFSIPSMEEAVDQAIEAEVGCIALIDATIAQEVGFFTQGWVIEGDCLVDPFQRDRKLRQ